MNANAPKSMIKSEEKTACYNPKFVVEKYIHEGGEVLTQWIILIYVRLNESVWPKLDCGWLTQIGLEKVRLNLVTLSQIFCERQDSAYTYIV